MIVVAGISTKYKGHPHPYVKIPFHPSERGHPITELRQDCAVIIGWYHALFIADDITAFSGDVPPDLMRTLNAKIFAEYVTAVGKQYANSLEMLADLREALIRRESQDDR